MDIGDVLYNGSSDTSSTHVQQDDEAEFSESEIDAKEKSSSSS
jgi:hypothetical protein